jgi:hypothetical protein
MRPSSINVKFPLSTQQSIASGNLKSPTKFDETPIAKSYRKQREMAPNLGSGFDEDEDQSHDSISRSESDMLSQEQADSQQQP